MAYLLSVIICMAGIFYAPHILKLMGAQPEVVKEGAIFTRIMLGGSLAIMLPAPGRFYFFNSWLPHSITRNTGTDPTVLIHFNITVGALPQQAEAIVV